MASNGERSTNGPSFRHHNMRSPPPPFRPPPPLLPPPLAPASPISPITRRKLSVNAPFEQANVNFARESPGPSPKPPSSGFPPKRPVEPIDDHKIYRFGESRLKSPQPSPNPPPGPIPPTLQTPGMILQQHQQQQQQTTPAANATKINGFASKPPSQAPNRPTSVEVDFLDILKKRRKISPTKFAAKNPFCNLSFEKKKN